MDLSKDINTITRLENSIKILKLIETALTVGIIGFTVFRAIAILKEQY
ncbi:MAG: hypothetical protein J6B37_02660 [Clostridia bacterium]|nr:hypothetical protein [Clostridia bacterium]